MIKVTIIGSGNVAHHLITAFQISQQIQIVQVFARKKEALQNIVSNEKITSNFNDLKFADLYLISIVDDAIFEVSDQLPFSDRLVVHTSGTKPMSVLSDKNRKGVFYPLQSFSKDKKLNFKKIPICLESETEKDYEFLKKIARLVSDKIVNIDSEKRKALHVSAVFVSNFVNHLYRIGSEICVENDISFEILKPLISEIADKIRKIPPEKAQTGPAQRGDLETIRTHLEFLKNNPENQSIYDLITQAIIHKNEKL